MPLATDVGTRTPCVELVTCADPLVVVVVVVVLLVHRIGTSPAPHATDFLQVLVVHGSVVYDFVRSGLMPQYKPSASSYGIARDVDLLWCVSDGVLDWVAAVQRYRGSHGAC